MKCDTYSRHTRWVQWKTETDRRPQHNTPQPRLLRALDCHNIFLSDRSRLMLRPPRAEDHTHECITHRLTGGMQLQLTAHSGEASKLLETSQGLGVRSRATPCGGVIRRKKSGCGRPPSILSLPYLMAAQHIAVEKHVRRVLNQEYFLCAMNKGPYGRFIVWVVQR